MRRVLFMLLAVGGFFAGSNASAYYYGTAWDESISAPGTSSHGLPTDAPYLDQEYAAGLRLRNVYIRWSSYETAPGVYNADYILQKQEEIRRLREKGFAIILRINPFPVPAWYWASHPEAHFRNQYISAGEPGNPIPAGQHFPWDPENHGQEGDGLVSFWEPDYRTAFAAYMARVFSDLGNNFWAVYLTIGKWGEAAFPEAKDYYGHSNCYWAYDDYAKASRSGNPLIANYVPGAAGILGERAVNGGFENTAEPEAIAAWEASLDCHYVTAWQPQVQSGGAAEGANYLRYTTLPDQVGKHYHLRQALVLKPGTAYSLSAAIRAVTSGTTGHVTLSQPVGQDNWAEVASVSSAASTWETPAAATFTSVTYTTKAYLDIFLTSSQMLATADFDRISVTDGAAHDPAAAQAFLDWYYQGMIDFINWQIGSVKQHYDGRLILMGGGFMARPGDVEAEAQSDLTGFSQNAYWVIRGFVPARYLAGLTDTKNVIFANTSLQAVWKGEQWREPAWGTQPVHLPAWELSPLSTEWSAPHYYARLADRRGLAKYGENAGYNNAYEMADAFQMMADYGYLGLGWYTVGQLFENGWASLGDYAANIAQRGAPSEPEGFSESFTSAAGVRPPGWRDDFNATVRGDGDTSGVITLASASPAYGSILSPVYRGLTTTARDGKVFNTLQLKISSISANTAFDIGVQLEQAPYTYYPAFSGLNAAGEYSVNINAIAPGADLSQFSLKFWINGPSAGSSAAFDYVRLEKEVAPIPAKPATRHVTDMLFTGMETSDLQVRENTVLAASNVIGYDGEAGPVCRVENSGYRDVPAFEGGKVLYLSGDMTATPAYCYYTLADGGTAGFSAIPVVEHTRLAFWIYNKSAGLPAVGNCHVSVDLLFSDGTSLRNLGLVDQRGVLMHPNARRENEYNQWIYVECDLSSKAGTSIQEIRVGFDTDRDGGHYETFIDGLRIYSGPTPGKDAISTNWETGEPFGFRNTIMAKNNVEGFLSYLPPECSPRPSGDAGVAAFRGRSMLMAAGNALATPAYCYYWLLSDTWPEFHNITIENGMRLAYRIYHFQNWEAGNHHVSVDFHCTDGTELRNTGIVDQNGVVMHPAGRNDPYNQWVYVEADLSALAGKVIDRVVIGFDENAATGKYRAYIDDLQFLQAGRSSLRPVTSAITPTPTPTASATITPTPTPSPSPTVTMTATPTVTATLTPVPGTELTLWQDHFGAGVPGDQPAGWYDATDTIAPAAEISYAGSSLAQVTVANSGGWGKVVSFSQPVDLAVYRRVEIVISQLSGATVRVGIFHPEPYAFWDFLEGQASISSPGIYQFDIPATTLESGVQTYGIQIAVEGAQGAMAVIDAVRIYGYGSGTTPTVTLTSSLTLTASPTMTATPSPTPTASATDTTFPTPSSTVTLTETSTLTHTPSVTDTATLTATQSATSTPSRTATPSTTATPIPSSTASFTSTPTGTATPSFTRTSTRTHTPSVTDTATLTATPSSSATPIPSSTASFTSTPTGTATPSFTRTSTRTHTPSVTDTATLTATRSATSTPSRTATPSSSATPIPSSTASFTSTPTGTSTRSATSTLTRTATATATATRTPGTTTTFTATATPSMTATPLGMLTPTATPALSPQVVRAWPQVGYIMGANQTQFIFAKSFYQGLAQPGVTIRFQVVRGSGRFNGSTVAFAVTGPQTPAAAAFTATQPWETHLLRMDNGSLGGQAWIPIVVLPWLPRAWTCGSEACAAVYDSEDAALAAAQALLRQALADGPLSATATWVPDVPADHVLVYPNPGRGHIRFAYAASAGDTMAIAIYQFTGERVASLIEHPLVSGTAIATWQAIGVSPGVYLCRIVITGEDGRMKLDQKKKVVLVK